MENETEERTTRREKKQKDNIPFWAKCLILIAMIFVFRTFVMGTIYVKGSSMEPNFYHGDLLFMNKLATSIGTPEKDDIVICQLNIDGDKEKIIKRVIGVPGDEIDLVWNEDSFDVQFALYINGTLVEEPYLAEPMMTAGDMDFPFIVPEGSYFVMGDNRNASTDSRKTSVGAVEKKDIIGQVIFRFYPFDQIGIIS